jgi:hypothetical protein
MKRRWAPACALCGSEVPHGVALSGGRWPVDKSGMSWKTGRLYRHEAAPFSVPYQLRIFLAGAPGRFAAFMKEK